jgi:uncharacterized protein
MFKCSFLFKFQDEAAHGYLLQTRNWHLPQRSGIQALHYQCSQIITTCKVFSLPANKTISYSPNSTTKIKLQSFMSIEQHDDYAAHPAAPTPIDPAATGQRNLLLDVLRGVAVLAALVVSVWAFGGFTTNMQNKLLLHPSGGNYRLFATVSLLLEGKMRALVALVFGAGLVLYLHSRQQHNKDTAHDLHVRRLLWLMGFGIVNAFVLLWPYDLLFHLGVMGILTVPFIQAKPRGLMIAALAAMLIFCGKQYWNYADDKKALRKYEAVVLVEKKIKQDSTDRARKDSANKAVAKTAGIAKKDPVNAPAKKDSLTKEQMQDKQAWEGKLKSMKYDPKNDEGDRKAMRTTSYGEVWKYIMPKAQEREAQWTYRTGIWELGMMILLGMALLKLGFFEKRYPAGRYLLWGLAGIGLGLLLGWFRLYFHNATLLDYTKYIKGHAVPYNMLVPLERSTMALGYAALLAWLTRSTLLAWLWNALAAVGRLSLTNYLLQSLFCTLFFTGAGMNSYGNLPQWQLYLVVAEVVLAQTIFSIFWLRYFDIGPAEWLWRSLTEKKKLPWRKTAAGNEPVTI